MDDKLIKIDYERMKAIFLRTFYHDDGTTFEKEIEVDLPKQEMAEGILKKIKYDENGKMYETEERILLPFSE